MEPSEIQTTTAEMVDPRNLRPHPDNPRGVIDTETPEFIAFSDDIGRRGIIQPIVANAKNLILAGHRRHAAALRIGLLQVPVVRRELSGSEFIEDLFLAENMQRQDLSPLEEARTIDAIRSKLERQQKRAVPVNDLVRRLQIPRATITARLAILQLPERIQQLFHIREIPVNSSVQLVRLADWPDEICKFADRLVMRQITARSLDALITRRMRELQLISDNEATLARDPALARIKKHFPENSHTPALTREIVMANVAKKFRGSVSMVNLKAVFDSTCCSCGMIGNVAVCLSCPLPKFINGLVGRADGVNDFEDDDE